MNTKDMNTKDVKINQKFNERYEKIESDIKENAEITKQHIARKREQFKSRTEQRLNR